MSLHDRGRAVLGGRRKTKTVKLGRKGSFKIKHPGEFRRLAQEHGKTTAEYAKEKEHSKGRVGRMARSAEGLMHMG